MYTLFLLLFLSWTHVRADHALRAFDGNGFDPHGGTVSGQAGGGIDPNGTHATGDNGCGIDPNGGCRGGLAGPRMDDNG